MLSGSQSPSVLHPSQRPTKKHLVAVLGTLRTLAFVLPLSLGLIAQVGCTSSGTSSAGGKESNGQAQDGGTWSGKMHALSQTLSELLPLVASRTQFNADENQAKIVERTQGLRALAHGLQSTKKPSEDPNIKIMSSLFAEDIDRALESLKNGNREYARSILRDTTAYCIQCHTQTNHGPNFPQLSLNINTDSLTPLNRAEFFAATRQFDRALDAYKVVIKDESFAQAISYEWEQAARSALAIVVRVKQDPKATNEMLNAIASNKSLPEPIKKSLVSWRKAVKDWEHESSGLATRQATSPKDLLAKSETQINRAQKAQEFPLDHSQDILYFRASSLLHNALSTMDKKDTLVPKALYLAGVAAEATRDMNFWTLHETYYEMCIQQAPHTALAGQCFEKLKDSVTLGYSGSGGTHVPADVAKRLSNLKSLADQSGKSSGSGSQKK